MFAQVVSSTVMAILIYFVAFKIVSRYTATSLSSGKQPQRQSDPVHHNVPPGVEVRQIYPSVNETIETEFNIIAIHGLDTKSPDTWIWRNPEDANSVGVNWLSDLLPRNFPKARIFTCDWPANLFKRSDTIQTTTTELARSLLLAIEARQHGSEDRPIIFIASCLGGIVLAQALILAAASRSEYANLWKATTGIVFLATPFRGTAFKQIARQSVFFLKGFAMLSGRRVTNLLDSVGSSTPFLEDLVGAFTSICLYREDACQLSVFYETGRGNLWRKLLPSIVADVFFKQQVLVDASSARLDVVQNPISLERSHVMMNKFAGPEDPGYRSIAAKVEAMVRNMRIESPVAQADAFIRRECYKKERLRIQRLSGHLLDMDKCYINLATVKGTDRVITRGKDGLDCGDVGDNDHVDSPFKIATRLRVERPSQTTEVRLERLFDAPPGKGEILNRPHRVLIRGRAGVGKSTLCKKIVHNFIHESMWYGLYDRILWVPLRNLKQADRRRPGYSLGDLLGDEFLHVPQKENLTQALWQDIMDSAGTKTLFLLDGLDEVTSDLEGDLERFLETLLNQPNIILTSRPHATLPYATDAFDVELETIGFYPQQVEEYVSTSFPPESGSENKTANNIREFLRSHPLVQTLVRIPVQLDALCYTWDENLSGAPPQTMTGLYQAMTESLWKKDLVKLGKVAEQRAKVLSWRSVKLEMKEEIEFLEAMSFAGLCTDTIDFDANFRDSVIDHLNEKGHYSLADDILPGLSFLRTSDPSIRIKDRQYHFIHLTFQEFFAAGYFARKWKANEKLEYYGIGTNWNGMFPKAFLREHKYQARYNVFWRFVAGVMDSDEGLCTVSFFEAVEQQPRDILGPTHQRLVLPCLGEVILSRPSPELSKLESRLEDELVCLMIAECELTEYVSLASADDIPESSLSIVFESESRSAWPKILCAMSRRSTFSQDMINQSLLWLRAESSGDTLVNVFRMWLKAGKTISAQMLDVVVARLEDRDWHVREAAIDVLKGQMQLSQQMLDVVVARLEDRDWHVREAAIDVLKNQMQLSLQTLDDVAAKLGHYNSVVRRVALDVLKSQFKPSQQILDIMVARLEDDNPDTRQGAFDVLKSQLPLSQQMLDVVVARLEDRDWHVREAAIDVLKGQPQLSQQMLDVVVARLEDRDWHVRKAAIDVLKGQPQLSQQMLDVVVATLEDRDWHVREAAVVVLKSQLPLSQQTLDVVVARLEDRDWHVREAAIDVLKGQPQLSQQMLDVVVARLEDRDWYVREAAIVVLKGQPQLSQQMLDVVVARLEDKDWHVREAAIDVLKSQSKLSQQTLDSVVAKIEDENSDTRNAAIDVLKSQAKLSQQILNVVAARLADDHSDVRWVALEVLKSQPPLSQQMLDDVIARLEDRDWHIRWVALHVLKSQPQLSQQMLDIIVVRLVDDDPHVRRAAVDVLKGQPQLSQKMLNAVIARLGDHHSDVRQAALCVFESQPQLSQHTLGGIAVRLDDPKFYVRRAAIDILKGQPQLSQQMLDVVVARLEDRDWYVREAAIVVLKGQPQLSQQMLDVVVATLEDRDWHVREAAVVVLKSQLPLSQQTLDVVVARLEDRDWYVREAAIVVLKGQPQLSQQTLDVVVARLEDRDWHVREAAIDVLKGQPQLSQQMLDVVVARLEDDNSDVRWVALDLLKSQLPLSQQMLDVVVARLEDRDWHVREAAIDVLKSQPQLSQQMLNSVAARLGDDNSDVRRVALDVLKTRPQLSQQTLDGVAAKLGHDDSDVRKVALDVLKSQSFLHQRSLAHHTRYFVNHILKNSFSEDIYWTVQGDASQLVIGTRIIDVRGEEKGLQSLSQYIGEILGNR